MIDVLIVLLILSWLGGSAGHLGGDAIHVLVILALILLILKLARGHGLLALIVLAGLAASAAAENLVPVLAPPDYTWHIIGGLISLLLLILGAFNTYKDRVQEKAVVEAKTLAEKALADATGAAAAVAATLKSEMDGRFQRLNATVAENEKESNRRWEQTIKDYVTKVDLNGHLTRLEDKVDTMNDKLDSIILGKKA